MSLRVWLPLNGSIDNKGCDPVTITNSGAVINENGKLGKCYSFSSAYMKAQNVSLPITCWSMAVWACPGASSPSGHQYIVGMNTSSASDFLGVIAVYQNKLCVRIKDTTYSTSITYTLNTWYHISAVYDGKLKIYVDGVLDQTIDSPVAPVSASTLYIGMRGSSGYYFSGKINDVRVYDHALSLAEIKELAKGLVCHYKLDDFYSSDNLIVNGFGELGTENWTSTSAISTTEIPSGHSEIKASFYGGNMTVKYIPICRSHAYTMSGYVKAQSGATGTKYPSIYPYDKDKLFIQNYHSRDGFDVNTLTTLTQPLHTGDTVVHAADLSKWRVDTTSYYYYCAIFGYKNSFGEVYGDLVYTRDCPTFGTRTDKSNIDKTNNTITLLAAYTGVDRPVGTSICQSAAGSSNYYPWGGIAVTSVADWTFKTNTITPSKVNRLWACEYIRWNTYGGLYIAGNKLVDNFLTSTDVIDSSGLSNHGTRTGNISVSYDSPRHDISTNFTAGSHIYTSTLATSGFADTYTFSWWGKYTYYSSRMMWGFSNGNGLNLYIYNGGFYWNTMDGSSNPFNVSAETYGDGNWHHFAVTGNGTTTKLYIDGEFKANAKTYKGITGSIIYMNGCNNSSSYNFNGQLSDFRVYATALSADDILALYNVGAKVANTGTMMGYQIKEG